MHREPAGPQQGPSLLGYVSLTASLKDSQCHAMGYLVQVAPQQGAQDGGGLHDQDEVPVNQRPVEVRVPARHVEGEVGDGAAHDGDVGERHRRVGREACTKHTPRCVSSSRGSMGKHIQGGVAHAGLPYLDVYL